MQLKIHTLRICISEMDNFVVYDYAIITFKIRFGQDKSQETRETHTEILKFTTSPTHLPLSPIINSLNK